jgi:cell division protein FtsB
MIKILFNPWALGGILLLALVISSSLQQTSQKAKISADQLKSLTTEVANLELNVASSAAIASQSSNPFYKEKVARDQLLWQKPGEIVVQLPPISPTPTQLTRTDTQTPWEAWKKLLLQQPF